MTTISHTVTMRDKGISNSSELFDALLKAGNNEGAFKVDANKYLANKRYMVETAGLVLGGMSIQTDRASQSMVSGARLFTQDDPQATVKFKTIAGFVELNATQIAAIGLAVAMHVQGCFAKEAELAAGITNGTITTAAQIDSAAWPANS